MMAKGVTYSSMKDTFALRAKTDLMVPQPINSHSANHDALTSNIKKEFGLMILRGIDADVPIAETRAARKSDVLEETY